MSIFHESLKDKLTQYCEYTFFATLLEPINFNPYKKFLNGEQIIDFVKFCAREDKLDDYDGNQYGKENNVCYYFITNYGSIHILNYRQIEFLDKRYASNDFKHFTEIKKLGLEIVKLSDDLTINILRKSNNIPISISSYKTLYSRLIDLARDMVDLNYEIWIGCDPTQFKIGNKHLKFFKYLSAMIDAIETADETAHLDKNIIYNALQ